MQLHRFSHIQAFWQQAQDYLLQYPAEHNLLLGITQSLLQDPNPDPEVPYLAIAETQGQVLAVALRTPPYKLLLSKAQDLAALPLLAQDVWHHAPPPPGVSGLVPEVSRFVQAWQTFTHQSPRRVIALSLHQLTEVRAVAPANGQLRRATLGDRPLLLAWFTAFAAEVGEVVSASAAQMVDGGLKRQSIYLWEDSVPVAFACGSQLVATAARIGPVYTPVTHRRRGYGTAGVAALSQQFLAQGCQRCFLFTDPANSTSNHIYQEIGYQPVCDWHDYAFISQPAP